MKMSSEFSYIEHVEDYAPVNALVARFGPIVGYDALLKAYYDKLNFPGYFGFNWDALRDCLGDFSWIETNQIILIHDCLPQLSKKDLKIYLTILSEASSDWKSGEKHQLEIVFPQELKPRIERLWREGS